MAKRTKAPVNILAARQAEAEKRAAEAIQTGQDTPSEPEKVAGDELDGKIGYSIEDVFLAFGQAQWEIRLLTHQVNVLKQQVRTYRNLVNEQDAKLKEAAGAPS